MHSSKLDDLQIKPLETKSSVSELLGCEDEINLEGIIRVLWKYKLYIVLACCVIMGIYFISIFMKPRNCKITFTYTKQLDDAALRVLEDIFYSNDNIGRIIEELRQNGFDAYANKLLNTKTRQELEKLIFFENYPTRQENANNKESPPTSTLLCLSINANEQKNISNLFQIIKNNFKAVIPLYAEKERLTRKIISIKKNLAEIDENRYQQNIQKASKSAVLEKLNKLEDLAEKVPGSNVVLQFNEIRESANYLPLSYQKQAAKIQLINIEEKMNTENELYNYDSALLNLNEKILAYMENAISSGSTLTLFKSYLLSLMEEYKDNIILKDYLNSYIRQIEIKLSEQRPVVNNPKIFVSERSGFTKTAAVFITSLIFAVLTAFVFEALQKNQKQLT